MKKILVIDNYDSFTYNLVSYLRELGQDVCVYLNDSFELSQVEGFDKILLSPGPGVPDEAHLLKKVITDYAPSKSILGVCLGHQAIAEVFGAKLVNLSRVYHGVATEIHVVVDDEVIYKNIPSSFEAGRYHSWVVSLDNFPKELEVTSFDDNKNIMSIRHKKFDVKGVQFHPESILTPHGKEILNNWVNL